MSCSVAVTNSPVFSSSQHQSLFTSSTLSPRPRISSSSSSSSTHFQKNFKVDNSINSNGPSTSGSGCSQVSAPHLKRKRPSMINIPMMSLGFNNPASPKPAQDASVVMEEEDRDGFYSVYCKKGRRAFMEDRFSAKLDLQGNPHQAFFGVFDGHGGSKAAEYAAKNLDKNIMAEVSKTDDNIEEAVKHGYMKTDSDFLNRDVHGGSCCVTTLITDGNLVVSNAGDCRAVMSTGGVAEALTIDHRPSRQDEKDRIEAKGGYIDCYNGVWRIQGSLAVSRGIGDRQLKQWVTAEPETKVVKIKPNDEFIIMASDGLWDKVSNQEAVDIARPLCTGSNKLQSIAACKKLVDLSVSRGSFDDVSVMVIQLERFTQEVSLLE